MADTEGCPPQRSLILLLQYVTKHRDKDGSNNAVHDGSAKHHNRVNAKHSQRLQAAYRNTHNHREGIAGKYSGNESNYRRESNVLSCMVIAGNLREDHAQQAADNCTNSLRGEVHHRSGIKHGNLRNKANQKADNKRLSQVGPGQNNSDAIHGNHEIGLHARKGKETRNSKLQYGASRNKNGNQDKILNTKAFFTLVNNNSALLSHLKHLFCFNCGHPLFGAPDSRHKDKMEL